MTKKLLYFLLPALLMIMHQESIKAQNYGSEVPESLDIESTVPTGFADMNNFHELEPVTVTAYANYNDGFIQSYNSIATATSWNTATSTGSYMVDDLPWAAGPVTVTTYREQSSGPIQFTYSQPIPQDYNETFIQLNNYYLHQSSTPPPPPPKFKDSLPPCDSLKIAQKYADSIFSLISYQKKLDTLGPTLDTLSFEKDFRTYQIFKYESQNNNNISLEGDSSSTIETNYLHNRTISNYSSQSWNIRQAALTHTHPGKVDGQTYASFPSVTDVFGLIETFLFFQDSINTSFIHTDNYVSFILAADGEKFAIMVTNLEMAKQFYYTKDTNLDTVTNSWAENTSISKEFIHADLHFRKSYAKSGDKSLSKKNWAFEMAMTTILNSNKTGITVMKADANDHFKALTNRINNDPDAKKETKYIDPGCYSPTIENKNNN